MRTAVPRAAAIHDLSGFGRTSLTVVIPILSTMGVQVCPLPTAVLSAGTEFPDFSFLDLTAEMRKFLDHWERLDLRFDAVYSGFLASPEQAEITAECIERCLLPDGLAMVDPVMGDNGKLEPTMTPEMVDAMRRLVGRAHCITPNYFEACRLLDEPYEPEKARGRVKEQARKLTDLGPEIAVITSAPAATRPQDSAVVAYHRKQNRWWKVDCPYIPAFYPGTGDIFTSVLTGSLLQGDSLPTAMDRAVYFVSQCIRATFGHSDPNRYGVLLERVLGTLHSPAAPAGYELMGDE